MATVLVADDDPEVVELVRTILGLSGIACRSVADGESALRSVQEDPPDCVIIDIAMPGLSGLAVCAELRASPGTSAIPIILLTGFGRRRDISTGYASGADEYIVKPFRPQELLERVQALLNPVRQQRWTDRPGLSEVPGLSDRPVA
jgi:DNA-binding response OmpR family regulator